jgi:hypothetical protein
MKRREVEAARQLGAAQARLAVLRRHVAEETERRQRDIKDRREWVQQKRDFNDYLTGKVATQIAKGVRDTGSTGEAGDGGVDGRDQHRQRNDTLSLLNSRTMARRLSMSLQQSAPHEEDPWLEALTALGLRLPPPPPAQAQPGSQMRRSAAPGDLSPIGSVKALSPPRPGTAGHSHGHSGPGQRQGGPGTEATGLAAAPQQPDAAASVDLDFIVKACLEQVSVAVPESVCLGAVPASAWAS